MKTVAEQLAEDVARLRLSLIELVGKHSSILTDRPDPESPVVVIGPRHSWRELSSEGRQAQTRLLREYSEFYDLICILTRGLSAEGIRELKDADQVVRPVIDQSKGVWNDNKVKLLQEALEALSTMHGLLSRLDSASDGMLVVPDTNALLAAPHVDRWQFEGCDRFAVVLMPTILGELDQQKVYHKSPNVQNTARDLIRRFKELFRRGNIHAGVPIVTGKITLQAVAREPREGESLSWLDPTNNDDRFLASVIELMRTNIRSRVAIVSEDINMLNKATPARIPVIDPPETKSE